jgi:hypothetical protein
MHLFLYQMYAEDRGFMVADYPVNLSAVALSAYREYGGGPRCMAEIWMTGV